MRKVYSRFITPSSRLWCRRRIRGIVPQTEIQPGPDRRIGTERPQQFHRVGMLNERRAAYEVALRDQQRRLALPVLRVHRRALRDKEIDDLIGGVIRRAVQGGFAIFIGRIDVDARLERESDRLDRSGSSHV